MHLKAPGTSQFHRHLLTPLKSVAHHDQTGEGSRPQPPEPQGAKEKIMAMTGRRPGWMGHMWGFQRGLQQGALTKPLIPSVPASNSGL